MAGGNSFNRNIYTGPGGITLAYLDSGGDKPLLHFFHANGFPTAVYLPLLQELTSQFRVIGLSLPGQDGLGGEIESWEAIADHLTDFIGSLNLGPVIGVGHSIGAVCTMIGAVKKPVQIVAILHVARVHADDCQQSSGRQHTVGLGNERLGIIEMVDGVDAEDDVETVTRIGQRIGIAQPQAELP